MKKLFFLLFCLLVICFALLDINAQTKSAAKIKAGQSAVQNNYQPISMAPSPALQTLLNNAVDETINKFSSKGLKSDFVAATLIDLREASNLRWRAFAANRKFIRQAS